MRLVPVDYVCSNPLHDENETHARRKSSRLYVCTAMHCMMSMKRTNALSYSLTWVDVTYFYCILRVTVRKSSQARSVKVSELGLLGLLSLRGLVGKARQIALCRQLVAAIHCMMRMKRTSACSHALTWLRRRRLTKAGS